MAELTAKWAFNGIHDTEAANAEDPAAVVFSSIAEACNHLCGRNWRVIFNQHVTDGMLPAAPAGNISPLYRIYWNDNWPHFRQYNSRVIVKKLAAAPPINDEPRFRGFAGGASAEIGIDAYITSVAPTEAQDVASTQRNQANTVNNAYVNTFCATFDSLRPIAVAVVGKRWEGIDPTVLSADAGAVIPTLFANGKHITHTDLITLRDAIDRIWKDNRRNFAAFSAIGDTNTSPNTISVTSATNVNLMDQAVTARSATSPGLICPIRYVGRLGATQVEATAAVYAEGDGGTGTVDFISSQGTVSIGSITTKQWYQATASTLLLGDTTTDEYDKVDVLGRVTAGTLRVWAWSIQEDPL